MRIVFFGSGSFGLPALARLLKRHEVALVVSQPQRPAGRGLKVEPTAVAAQAAERGLPLLTTDNVNSPEAQRQIAATGAAAYVVIAFGQKLGPDLLRSGFAINLHASMLPKYRGAAPINWAMINGETHTGVTVIQLSDRMDAGEILGAAQTVIDPLETAGELHDRLAEIGARAVIEVLDKREDGSLTPVPQNDALASRAPKLTRALGRIDFDKTAAAVRARIHGLTPWPGCNVSINGKTLKLLRVRDHAAGAEEAAPGLVLADGKVACRWGQLELLSVQPPGGKAMSFAAYCHGHDVKPGARLTPA